MCIKFTKISWRDEKLYAKAEFFLPMGRDVHLGGTSRSEK
jgi:hypothetical protein